MADKIPYNLQPRIFPEKLADKFRNYGPNDPVIWIRESPIDRYLHKAPMWVSEKYFCPEASKRFNDDGPLTNDEYGKRILGWLRTTEESQMLDVVPVADEIGYTEHIHQVPIDVGGIIKYKTPEHVLQAPMNKVGKYVSMAETARQNYMNLLDSSEGNALFSFMGSKGYKPTWKIDRVAAGYLHDRAIAAISWNPIVTNAPEKDKYAFVFSKGALHKIAEQAAIHGVDIDFELLNTAMHEMVHTYGIRSERELEELLTEFYSKMADKEARGYTDTPASSRSEYRKWNSLRKIAASRARMWKTSLLGEEDISNLVRQWYKEAQEKGLNEEEVEQYVEQRSRQTFGGKKGSRESGEYSEGSKKEQAEGRKSNRHSREDKEERSEETAEEQSEETLDDRVEEASSEAAD